MQTKSIKEALCWATDLLNAVSDTAKLDSSILLEFVTGTSSANQIAFPDKQLSEEELRLFTNLVARRIQKEPVAYLINEKGFWKYDFFVDKRVLIPRPETELLVENSIEFILQNIEYFREQKTISILDLGCGSGCIGLSVIKDLIDNKLNQDIKINLTLIDKSSDALDVAKINIEKLGLNIDIRNLEINPINSDWFSNISGTFDLILSNPPYIQENDSRVYDGGVFEPKEALYSKEFGLKDIKIILDNYKKYINLNYLVLIEVGLDTFEYLSEYTEIEYIKDLSGYNRVIKIIPCI